MDDLKLLAIAVSAVAVQVVSTVYYIGFGKQLMQLHPAYAEQANTPPPPTKLLLELIRNLLLATIIAVLVSELEITEFVDGLKLGVALWAGFPLVLWTGAIMWERTPVKLAAIHLGDWFLKPVIISIIVTIWN